MSLISSPMSSVMRPVLGSVFDVSSLVRQWSPDDLFDSRVGAWYDPSDWSTLFQDVSGITPVTSAGQLVALMRDKSGSGRHMVQPNAASRPILGVDGAGVFGLKGGWMSCASFNLSAFSKVACVVSVQKDSDGQLGLIAELSANASNNPGTFNVFGPSGALQNYGNRARGATSTSVIFGTANRPAPSRVVLTTYADLSAPLLTLGVNSGVDGYSSDPLGGGNFSASQTFFLGRRNGAEAQFIGLITSLILVGGSLSADELRDVQDWTARNKRISKQPIYSGWGSSSTELSNSAWVSLADAAGGTYYNGGKSGELGQHTLARLGSRPALITVSGGSIPASGGVTVVASNMPASSSLSPYAGTLAGIAGTLSSTASVLTFTRTSAGSVTPVPDGTAFIPTQGTRKRGDTIALWVGKNSLTSGTSGATVAQWTIDAVNWQLPVSSSIVIGHFIDRDVTESDPVRARILGCNEILRQSFGANYFDVQSWMCSEQAWMDTGITPTAEDIDYQQRGNKPPSLSADNNHFTSAAYSAIAARCFDIGKRIS